MNAPVQNRTHWKQLVNPKYLGVYCLVNGQDMTVTIKSVGREIVIGDGGKKEECTVAQLTNAKPMILNRTNCKTIEKMYGPYLEDWAGKSITVYETSTRVAGETVACLRIRKDVPNAQPVKEPLAQDRFEKAMQQVRDGKYDPNKLFSDYALTSSQIDQMNQEFGA
ncbi:MAG: hypothetical protein H9855_02885 [Candidatus Acinetobacter avistercoris]|nr:hypothetical protein [Candidatus Acinetobacter avistercoris]